MSRNWIEAECGRKDAAAPVGSAARVSSKEYKKAAPVRAELRAAAAWAK